ADRLRSIYKMPLFDSSSLRELKLLPTEYVYYYDQPMRAFDNVRRAGKSRGQEIAELNRVLFEALAEAPGDVVARYKAYLSTRSAGYMQIESGADLPALSEGSRDSRVEGGGYDKIALSVVRSIHLDTNAIIPLSVRNAVNIHGLTHDE